MNTTSLLKSAIVCWIYLSLTSCVGSYYCTLNSRGISPSEKTFYIVSPDTNKISILEFQEYAEILKERLNEVGYVERSQQDAALLIELDYNMGGTYLAYTTTTAKTYNLTYTNTNIKSGTNANASTKTNIYSDNNQLNIKTSGSGTSKTDTKVGQLSNTSGLTTYSTSNTYKIPLLVSITAFDNKSGNPVWEIYVQDVLDRETQIQSVMPWLLLSTKDYIGKSSNGEQKIIIRDTEENREKYRLVWPY